MNYTEAVNYFLNIPKFAKDKHDPGDLQIFLDELGNPEESLKLLHVAGTNGKGSVCAFLTSMLIAGKKRVATFTSPHLVKLNERFLLNGEEADDESFLAAFHQVLDCVERLGRQGQVHPTFFEFAFLIFMVFAGKKNAEYAVLETGIGGRLDATNCVKHPLVTVITSISRDHTEYLGETIPEIAGEKAGIIKPGVPVVYDITDPEAVLVIKKRAEELKSPAYGIGSPDYQILEMKNNGLLVEIQSRFHSRIRTLVPFVAEYQAGNAALAVAALEEAATDRVFTADVIACGIRNTVWPGRMEQVMPGLYLDGAHNEGGIREFVKTASRMIKTASGKVFLLFAVVSDKDYNSMARIVCGEIAFDGIFLTQIASGRALDVVTLEAAVKRNTDGRIYEFPSVKETVKEALAIKKPEDILFCVGSLYLIGEIKKVIEEEYR